MCQTAAQYGSPMFPRRRKSKRRQPRGSPETGPPCGGGGFVFHKTVPPGKNGGGQRAEEKGLPDCIHPKVLEGTLGLWFIWLHAEEEEEGKRLKRSPQGKGSKTEEEEGPQDISTTLPQAARPDPSLVYTTRASAMRRVANPL